MPRLQKRDLLQRIIQGVRLSGWDAVILSDEHPFRLSIFRGDTRILVICYIWNLTHGGYPRDPNELRIQVTGVDQFIIEPGHKTLLLGWEDDEGMFAGFDVTKHSTFGSSPSLQIRRETLEAAKTRDFDPQTRGNNEIAIAFRPEFFVAYVQEMEALHGAAQNAQDLEALQRIAQAGTDPRRGEQAIRDVPAGQRRIVMQQIQRKIRDARFRQNVIKAYRHRCAASDMQLDLLDAAHIVPVEHPRGTDELKNGLCLSPIHHRAFDRGLIGVTRDYRIVFNEERFGNLRGLGWDGGEAEFKESCRDAINLPARAEFYPDPDYLVFGQTLRGWKPRHLS